MPYITVAGIAGPGDPFAEPERTLKTLEIIKRAHPKLHLCLSTNGLRAAVHARHLAELGVEFVTITVNAVDPAIGGRIYRHVRMGDVFLKGARGATVLLERQMEGIVALKARGMTVKVNTVIVPGVNDQHAVAVAGKMASMGVDLMNMIPLAPVQGTVFARVIPPSSALMENLRREAGTFLPQMRHCARCRADAAGLLHDRHDHTDGTDGNGHR